jgi:hypothetical protein
MRDENERRAFARDLPHALHERMPRDQVEPRCRLVQHEDFR